jgi:hypothetical protein
MSNQDYWERTKYNPNLRRDALYVVQQQGNDAAKFFWGGLAALFAFFWPLLIHGAGGIIAKAAWWGFLGICAVVIMVAVSRRAR